MKIKQLILRPLLAVLTLLPFGPEAKSQTPEDPWANQRGITEGTLIEGSVSPDKKYALFEFPIWTGQTPDTATTATAIGLAPLDKSKLLRLVDSRTEWMTGKKVTSFLSFKWNPDSTLLATHDAWKKHSKLHIYRISSSGTAVSLNIPELLPMAIKKLGITDESITSSGQPALNWRTAEILEVTVRLGTTKGKLSTTLLLQVGPDGTVSTQ